MDVGVSDFEDSTERTHSDDSNELNGAMVQTSLKIN